jgi:Glycosyl transferases group 1
LVVGGGVGLVSKHNRSIQFQVTFMRFCFVGHKFHQKTRSSDFFLDVMKSLGEVKEFYSSPDEIDLSDEQLISQLSTSKYDCYVFYQTEYIAEQLASFGLGRFILVPMYDGAMARSAEFWRQFVSCDFISFSRTLHEDLQRFGLRTAFFQYFPEPALRHELDFSEPLSAFFWERLPGHEPTLQTVLRLCNRIGIKSLNLHAAPDKVQGAAGRLRRPETFVVGGVQVRVSAWIEERAKFDALIERSHFVFAPRALEGIGLSFLEAMSRGQIVVAPDRPTMNEYIRHRTTGVLYDLAHPSIDFNPTTKLLGEMSRAAIVKTTIGYQQWKIDHDRLTSILVNDGRRWSTKDFSSHFRNEVRRRASARARDE